MKVRATKTVNTPLYYIAEGTEFETEDAAILALDGIEPVKVKAERAVKPRGKAAVKE